MDAERLAYLRSLPHSPRKKNPDAPCLVSEGRKYGLKLGKNHSKADCIKRIAAAEAKLAVDATPTPATTETRPRNTDFEQAASQNDTLFSDGPQGRTEPPQAPTGPGGFRPGAGRPAGMTAEKARMKNLPEQPNPTVQAMVQMMFESWAMRVKVPEVALTDQEAHDLALPYTQVLYYMGYDQKIPPWLMLAVTSTWNTFNIVKLKMALVKAGRPDLFQKKDKQQPVKENKPDGHQGIDNHHRDGKTGQRQDSQGPEPMRKQATRLVL